MTDGTTESLRPLRMQALVETPTSSSSVQVSFNDKNKDKDGILEEFQGLNSRTNSFQEGENDANQGSKINIKNEGVNYLKYRSFKSPTKSSKCHERFIKRAFKVHNMLKWIL
ncbi:uncharacterized protein LOC132634069 [Lycium barbarum]|uniref:uncharacterized protein LOC132634069 n=1 Tax=Lycium barbarum TaxID=112863 RepID=UPI00293EB319|nr:uncharacterized protein LOC132634069 [Lycium barbarum]